MNNPPWFVDRAPPFATRPPPQAEVVIIGAGPSGLAAALVLAEAGTDVAVFEARPDVGQGFSARIQGTVSLGTTEPPHRLGLGLGDEDALALFAFTRDNLALARRWLEVDLTGGLWAAAMPGEEEDIAAGSDWMANHGIPLQAWTEEQVAKHTGACHLGPGRFVPEEGLVNPTTSLMTMADRAAAAGAKLFTGQRVEKVEETDSLTVHLARSTVKTEAVIWAAGADCQHLQAEFAEVIWPVRIQSITSDTSPGPHGPPGHGQHGHLAWRMAPDGSRVLTGCRWATPHLEVGETDEDTLSPQVDGRLQAVLARTWPGSEATRRWAGIAAFTCDGLPLIGPLPGHPRQVACVGFGGNDWSFALRAGQAVAQGLLTGKTRGVPERFSPARFIPG